MVYTQDIISIHFLSSFGYGIQLVCIGLSKVRFSSLTRFILGNISIRRYEYPAPINCES